MGNGISLACELVWVKHFLQELDFWDLANEYVLITKLLSTLLPIQCSMRGLNIEIGCHFIRENVTLLWKKLLSKEIYTEFVEYNDQLANALTKSLREPWIEFICSKFGTYNLSWWQTMIIHLVVSRNLLPWLLGLSLWCNWSYIW